MQREPGSAPTQEEGWEGPQRPEPGALQEDCPSSTVFRPGEQPPPGTHTRQEEEEKPEQETQKGEFKIFLSHSIDTVIRSYLQYIIYGKCSRELQFHYEL